MQVQQGGKNGFVLIRGYVEFNYTKGIFQCNFCPSVLIELLKDFTINCHTFVCQLCSSSAAYIECEHFFKGAERTQSLL